MSAATAAAYILTALIVTMFAFLGVERFGEHQTALVASAYGCGRHDAMQTATSDPAEYDLPPCDKLRKIWRESETWPPHK